MSPTAMEYSMEAGRPRGAGGVLVAAEVYVCRDCRFVFGDRQPQLCPVCRGTDFDDVAMG